MPHLPLSWPFAFPSAPYPVDHGRIPFPSLPHRIIPGFRPCIDPSPMAPSSLEFWNLLLRVLDLPGVSEPVYQLGDMGQRRVE